MLLLLARTFDYNLRTEDLLELVSGNRQVALEAVVGILEDGEVDLILPVFIYLSFLNLLEGHLKA
jgi:hypothetical protein